LFLWVTETLPLSGCAAKGLSVDIASAEDLGINSVTTVLPPVGQIAKSATDLGAGVGRRLSWQPAKISGEREELLFLSDND
jgi:hypothetical protein